MLIIPITQREISHSVCWLLNQYWGLGWMTFMEHQSWRSLWEPRKFASECRTTNLWPASDMSTLESMSSLSTEGWCLYQNSDTSVVRFTMWRINLFHLFLFCRCNCHGHAYTCDSHTRPYTCNCLPESFTQGKKVWSKWSKFMFSILESQLLWLLDSFIYT